MMRFFRSIARSFYDLAFYHEVRRDWQGVGFGLIAGVYAVILLVGLLVGFTVLHSRFVADEENGSAGPMRAMLMEIAGQWPSMRIAEGKMTLDAPEPHVISVTMPHETIPMPLITIDTSGQATHTNMKTPVLITEEEVAVKTSQKTEIRSIRDLSNGHEEEVRLDGLAMRNYMGQFADGVQKSAWLFYTVFGLFSFAVMLPILLLLRLCLLLPVALVGMLIAQAMGNAMPYTSAFRIMNVVLVPVTIIDAFSFLFLQSGVSIWVEIAVAIGIIVLISRTQPKAIA